MGVGLAPNAYTVLQARSAIGRTGEASGGQGRPRGTKQWLWRLIIEAARMGLLTLILLQSFLQSGPLNLNPTGRYNIAVLRKPVWHWLGKRP